MRIAMLIRRKRRDNAATSSAKGFRQTLLSAANSPETNSKRDYASEPHGGKNSLDHAGPRVQRRTVIDCKEAYRDEECENGNA
jgi:hypothetical protein